MQITENVHTFLNLFGVIGTLQNQVTSQLESTKKAELQALKARELKAMLVIARITLMRDRGLSLKELAMYLNTTIPTTSLLVTELVRRKLLCRKTDSENRRYVLITLSLKGKAMLEAMLPELTRSVDDLFAFLSAEEQKAFKKIAETLYQCRFPGDPEKGELL